MLPTWIPGLVLAMAFVPASQAQNELNRFPSPARDVKTAMSSTPTMRGSTAVNTAPDIPLNPMASARVNASATDNPLPARARLSPWTTEIVKLAQAGIDDGVMLSFVDNTPGTFNLGADQIIDLSDLGVSSQVITAMLEHDAEFVYGLRPVTASTVPASQPKVRITFAGSSDSSGQGDRQPAPTAASPAVMNSGLAEITSGESVPVVDHDGAFSQSSEGTYTMVNEFENGRLSAQGGPRQESKGGEIYPVRKPYPVELTAPIIVIKAWGRTPNAVIIEFSP
jgi:hypothetical protein